MKMSLGGYDAVVRKRAASVAGEVPRIWRRDATFWGGDDARNASVANRLGWLDVVGVMHGRIQEINAFASDVRAAGFRDAVVLGMGGSSLAPEVLRQSITDVSRGESALRLHILDTTDPATIADLQQRIDVAKTLFFVSSKSGTTLEALCLFAYFHALVVSAKGEAAGENFVAITDGRSPLEALASEHGFRRTFVNPSDIGGRYSALSYFGLVPSAVAGLDVSRLLTTAGNAVDAARSDPDDASMLGATIGELAVAGRDKCTFLISPGIESFGLWVEQLIAESTGKDGTGILPVVGEPQLDVASYGTDRCFVYLRLEGDDNAAIDAHAESLRATGHPVIRIGLGDIYDLGREFFNWQFATAIVGHILDINPFDEPNVQESKDNTNRMLAELERTGVVSNDGVAPGSVEISNVLEGLFSSIERHDYFAITAYMPAGAHTLEEFEHMRKAVATRYGVATTLGFGPRFLHSTGQFHKGGPQQGVFLQVLGEMALDEDATAPDIAIPGKPFTFEQLKRAQAAGDRASLVARGMPLVTVDVDFDYMLLENLCQITTAIIETNAARGG